MMLILLKLQEYNQLLQYQLNLELKSLEKAQLYQLLLLVI